MFRAAKITLFSLLAAAVIATSFGIGYMVSPGGGFAPPLLASEARAARGVPSGAPDQFKLLDEVWNVLQQDFVDPKALDAAARIGDGYIGTSPDAELVEQLKKASGGKPAQAGAQVAYAPTND